MTADCARRSGNEQKWCDNLLEVIKARGDTVPRVVGAQRMYLDEKALRPCLIDELALYTECVFRQPRIRRFRLIEVATQRLMLVFQ
jgi:hypothetical protein